MKHVKHKKSQSYKSAVEAGFEISILDFSNDVSAEDKKKITPANVCDNKGTKQNCPKSFLKIFNIKFPEMEKTKHAEGSKGRRQDYR